MTQPPRTQDDTPPPQETITQVELLPVAPVKSGRGMAMAALMLSVLASTLGMVALGIAVQNRQNAPASAEAVERQRVIDRALDRLEKQVALIQAEGGHSAGDLAANPDLVARLAALDERLSAVSAAQATQKIQSERLDRLNEDFQPLMASLASIEQRLRQTEARMIRQNSAHVTATVVASANIVAAVRTGTGFGAELAMLDRLTGDDTGLRDLVEPLRPYAPQGLPTAARLAAQLEAESGKALAALDTDPDRAPDTAWHTALWGKIKSLVTIRRVSGETEGDDPAALLARAVFRAEQQDLAGALMLIDSLPRPVRLALEGWRQQAQDRQRLEKMANDLLVRATERAALSQSTASGTTENMSEGSTP